MLTRVSLYLSLLTLFISSVLSGPTGLHKRVEIQRYTGDGETSGRHLVLLKQGASRAGVISQLASSADIIYEWDTVCNGFAAILDSVSLALLQTLPEVESIEEDGIMRTMGTETQKDAPWGLARLSSKNKLGGQDASQLNFEYTYDSSAGAGVDIYILDTGVNVDHQDFGGRAKWAKEPGFGATNMLKMDGHGHGTHVAGTAAGTQYGVAKVLFDTSSKPTSALNETQGATIYAIKVLSDAGLGSTSDIVAAMDYVAKESKESGRPTVVNMSLGGQANQAMDEATRGLVAAGVHVAVAAGNDNADADGYSPARVREAITVGASDISDAKASYSNFGDAVDVFAPGTDIISANNMAVAGLNNDRSLSGTSMASPHIAGLIAYLIKLEGNEVNPTPAAMQARLQELALRKVLTGVPAGTQNLLAHNKPQ